ncbi:phosphoribosylanthranilate isomerase [Simkania sp.]|uniref:phosphoribosylanthranilate isomerase n=1 Tax=Simkania sp. TaxID=34094 RepID=UPI003B5179BD
MILVKICGITDSKTAALAAKEGASFIGLIFEKSSHRYVTLKQAKEIADKTKKAGAIPVGVFTDHKADEIQKIVEEVGLEVIQLHGENARLASQNLPHHLTRLFVLHVHANGTIEAADLSSLDEKRDFLLYDGMVPGSGETFNWDNFHPIKQFRFFLAGGLNAENVQLAIKLKQPTAVDVSSGVENPKTKQKDPEKIHLFIQKVREVA